jgi:hypothetical protein
MPTAGSAASAACPWRGRPPRSPDARSPGRRNRGRSGPASRHHCPADRTERQDYAGHRARCPAHNLLGNTAPHRCTQGDQAMRQVRGIYSRPAAHWVGDGSPVRSMFSHAAQGEHVSPFLLLDHAGPAEFAPAEKRRGVGVHPHRGFETVTIVYRGEVEHRDSTGQGGLIGPGDVPMDTAAVALGAAEDPASRRRAGMGAGLYEYLPGLPAPDRELSEGPAGREGPGAARLAARLSCRPCEWTARLLPSTCRRRGCQPRRSAPKRG